MGGVLEPVVYGERGSASLFLGSGGLAPIGFKGKASAGPAGGQGGFTPEANEILTNEIHILY